jgi:hypothetical protein
VPHPTDFALLINEQFGVTDDVDEKDVPDLEPDLFLSFGGHSGTDLNYANLIIYSRCRCREQRRQAATVLLSVVSTQQSLSR